MPVPYKVVQYAKLFKFADVKALSGSRFCPGVIDICGDVIDVPAATVPGKVLTCELVPSVPVCVTPAMLRFAPAAVVAPVPDADKGMVPAATVSDGVVVEPVMEGTSHEGHDADGAEKLVTPVPEPPIGAGSPFTQTYITVLGHPAKNAGSEPEQVEGIVG